MTEPEDQFLNPDLLHVEFEEKETFRAFANTYYGAYQYLTSSDTFFYPKYHLICLSIESAAKALHSDQGKGWEQIKDEIRHDLEKACDKEILAKYGISLSDEEETVLKQTNEIYSAKGFEYFLYAHKKVPISMRERLLEMFSGYPEAPNLAILESIVEKLLKANIQND